MAPFLFAQNNVSKKMKSSKSMQLNKVMQLDKATQPDKATKVKNGLPELKIWLRFLYDSYSLSHC